MELTNPATVKRLLKEFHASPQKELGQNFLVSQRVLRKLIDAAELTKDDLIIEPGAGIGTVTLELAQYARRVIAYELDPKLIPILRHNLEVTLNPKGLKRVEIYHKDVLQALRGNTLNPKGLKVVGSIPYQITSPLIHEIIYQHTEIDSAVMIIQKEVAEKITASSPKTSYLSNFVQLFADVELINGRIVPAAFWPRPGVESALVRFKIYDLGFKSRNVLINPEDWSNFLHRGFKQPRKMLRKVFDEGMLKEAEIDPTARAQELSLKDWQKLFLLQAKK